MKCGWNDASVNHTNNRRNGLSHNVPWRSSDVRFNAVEGSWMAIGNFSCRIKYQIPHPHYDGLKIEKSLLLLFKFECPIFSVGNRTFVLPSSSENRLVFRWLGRRRTTMMVQADKCGEKNVRFSSCVLDELDVKKCGWKIIAAGESLYHKSSNWKGAHLTLNYKGMLRLSVPGIVSPSHQIDYSSTSI